MYSPLADLKKKKILYTVTLGIVFPVPSWDVTKQTLPGHKDYPLCSLKEQEKF